MISQLVHKGTRPSKEACYTPFNSQVKKVPAEIKSYYFSDEVSTLVDALADGRVIHLEELQEVKCRVQSIWERSEQRKAQIIQELKERRSAYPEAVLGVQHISPNRIVRLSKNTAQELVKDLNAINRLIENAFSSKKKINYNDIPRKKCNLVQ